MHEHGASRHAGIGLPAGDLVVVEFGQLVEERRGLGVLVDLALPAPRRRRRDAGAVDDGQAVEQAAGDRLGLVVVVGHLGRQLGAQPGDDLDGLGDLLVEAGARPAASRAAPIGMDR